MLGHLKLGSGEKLTLVLGSTTSLGRQHVRIYPAAAAVARCQCEVTVLERGAVRVTSRGVNPTAVLSAVGRTLLQQGTSLSLNVMLAFVSCQVPHCLRACLHFALAKSEPSRLHQASNHVKHRLMFALFGSRREQEAAPQRQAAPAGEQ